MMTLRTSVALLTMTKFPLAIAIWFGDPVLRVWGITCAGLGEATVVGETVFVAAEGGDPASCTKFPLIFNTENRNDLFITIHK